MEHDALAMMGKAFVAHPRTWERAVGLVIEAQDTLIRIAPLRRMGPAGLIGVHESGFAHDLRVRAVGAIEGDAPPVDERLARPRRGHAHRVMIVEYPGAALGHAARTFI